MTTIRSAQPTEAARRNIEAILPLLPLQKALHLRGALSVEDPGFLQVQCRLTGAVDPRRLETAWNEVVRANAALRMSCRGREAADPMVIVWKAVQVPWTDLDWSEAFPDEQARRLDEFLERDRATGLDVGEAPVMRVTAIRTADDAYEVVWTCHHLFVDGWSAALVLEQLLEAYGDPSGMVSSGAADAYRRYHTWATELDHSRAAEFWRERLGGYDPPARLALAEPGGTTTGFTSIDRELDGDVASAVRSAATSLHVPPNALLQAAWGLVLAALSDRDDIVFGITVAGRAAPIDGMERLIGFFSNVVPVRVRMGDGKIGDWVRGLRDEQFASQSHETAFLSDIQDWSGIAGGQPLFESLLVVENFPAAPARRAPIALTDFRSGVTTTFPVTLALALGESWRAHLAYDTARFGPTGMQALLDAFVAALRALADDPERRVADVCADTASLVPVLRTAPDEEEQQVSKIAARDTVERRLVEIMEQTLGLDDVGLRDDYFELGGTSVLAVRLFDAIEARLGVRLPIATLLDGATVEHLASVLREGAPSEWESLVPIQTEGSKPPLACVHAGDLHVLFYRPLALALGADQPVYGFEPVGRNGERAPLDTFPEIAAVYLRELRQIQPHGPYRLLGYCFGGALCWEIAHQLEAQGETVELLALLDTPFPAGVRSGPWRRALSILRSEGVGAAVRRGVAKLRRKRARTRALTGAATDRLLTSNWVREACKRAFNAYVPPECEATVTIIRSSEFASWRRSATHMRWSALAGGTDDHVVEARHPELLDEPALSEVAALANDRL